MDKAIISYIYSNPQSLKEDFSYVDKYYSVMKNKYVFDTIHKPYNIETKKFDYCETKNIRTRDKCLSEITQICNLHKDKYKEGLLYLKYYTSSKQFKDFEQEFKKSSNVIDYFYESQSTIVFLSKFPEEFEEYAALSQVPQYTGEGLKSDITLSILNSLKNPNYEFNFRDAWPTYLSSVEFDTTKTDINYITATAEFRYTLFDVVKL